MVTLYTRGEYRCPATVYNPNKLLIETVGEKCNTLFGSSHTNDAWTLKLLANYQFHMSLKEEREKDERPKDFEDVPSLITRSRSLFEDITTAQHPSYILSGRNDSCTKTFMTCISQMI